MKLLHIPTSEVVELHEPALPPYALVSYTWNVHDTPAYMTSTVANKSKHQSVQGMAERACEIATSRGISYLWIASFCVDTASTAELDEAVNGSFRRLRNVSLCLAYLNDLPVIDGLPFDISTWGKCRYWTRAWTLQELVLPPRVEFFDQDWNCRGSKTSPECLHLLANITGIPKSVLLDGMAIFKLSLATRISWSAGRNASRDEDIAYSLAAITGATISVRYGEGVERAFLRLQEEILHNTRDGSIFAWRSTNNQVRGLLARSPSEFRHFAMVSDSVSQVPWTFDGQVRFGSKGIRVQSHIFKDGSHSLLDIGQAEDKISSSGKFGVFLREWNGIYVRVNPTAIARITGPCRLEKIDVARDVDSQTGTKINRWFDTSSAYSAATASGRTPSSESNHDAITESTEKHQSFSRIQQACKEEDKNKESENSSKPAQLEPSSHTLSEDDFCYVSSTAERPASKRRRSGRLLRRHKSHLVRSQGYSSLRPNAQDDEIPTSSECDIDGSSSDSCGYSSCDSGSRRGDSESVHEAGSVEEYTLDENHEYQSMRPDLLQFSYNKIQTWMNSVQYDTPPDNDSLARKRARTMHWNPHSTRMEEKRDRNNSQLINVSHYNEYFHLSCPFYVFDQEKYQECLRLHDLLSIEDIIRHLRQRHTELPWCPMCCQTFQTAVERDKHARARTCEFRTPKNIYGINKFQMDMLARRDRPHLGNIKRWQRIWTVVFPHMPPRYSPYLKHGVGRVVSMARDYWARQGKDCVLKFLETRGLRSCQIDEEDRAFMSLYQLTLRGLLSMVLDQETMVQSDGKDKF